MKKKRHDLLVIIPAYNEESNIGEVLEKLEKPPISDIADVLVINDASKDDTNFLVKGRGKAKMVTHVFNLGYGSAIQLGYKYAVRRRYQYVIQMDADGQHDPSNIPVIYEELKKKDKDGNLPDIVLGSRYMGQEEHFETSTVKKIAYVWFRFMIKLFTGRRLADPTTGLQGLNRKAFLYYSKYEHFDDKYPDANMLTQMLLLKFKIREIPAVMHSRTSGVSMHSGWKPIVYMFRMTFSVLAVAFRYGVLKEDMGVGENDFVWQEKETDSSGQQ